MSETQKLNTDLRVRVSEEEREKVEVLVDERSEPGKRVSISEVLREALNEYLDEHEELLEQAQAEN
jgi:Arc/MetJ-type ribon-helix-helix transcriptional regulator